MKKLCYTAFIAFWSGIATLITLNALAENQPEIQTGGEQFTLADLAAHNTADDCWIAVEGKVYDITAYIPNHPAPPAVLLAWCGKEATEGMRTKGYGRDHSPAAWGMLDAYAKGTLTE